MGLVPETTGGSRAYVLRVRTPSLKNGVAGSRSLHWSPTSHRRSTGGTRQKNRAGVDRHGTGEGRSNRDVLPSPTGPPRQQGHFGNAKRSVFRQTQGLGPFTLKRRSRVLLRRRDPHSSTHIFIRDRDGEK